MNIPEPEFDPYAPYHKMYTTLFNAITTALDLIEGHEITKARAVLVRAQQTTEELYIKGNE